MVASANREAITATIVNLTTGKIINLTHIPEELEDSNGASFSEVNIQGRSAPVLGYDGGGPRTVRFSIQLHDDYCPEGIKQAVQDLKALTYPLYSGSKITPPRCYVRIGNILRITGVCDDVSVNWKKPYRDGVFVYADVSVSFKAAMEVPLSANDVQWGEG
jgi:hypothetical protein